MSSNSRIMFAVMGAERIHLFHLRLFSLSVLISCLNLSNCVQFVKTSN